MNPDCCVCVCICLKESLILIDSILKESLGVLLVNKKLTATVLQTEQGEQQAKMLFKLITFFITLQR